MKTTYKVFIVYGDEKVLFNETEHYVEAFDTAHEYVWAMGGVTQIMQYKNDKLVKVIQFESEGYVDEEHDVVVDEKVILQLI